MSQKKQAKVTYIPQIIQNKERNSHFWKSHTSVKYQVGKLLGRGGFAECYRVTELSSQTQYALKVIDKNSQNMKKYGAKQRLNNQIFLTSRLKHPNIIKLLSAFQDQHNYYLVLELCQQISLSQMIRRRTTLTQIQVKYFIRQLIYAVCYLKQLRIIHRDIKTANILLDSKLNVKLGDFGLAILADSNDPQRYNTCGTPSFMAPEVVNQLKYSFEIDMWSIGVVTYSLLCGTNPFICKKQQQIYDKIKHLHYQILTFSINILSSASKDFIKQIFVIDPKSRMTPQQALSHQFLTYSIPSYLPLQCYYQQIPKQQLLSLCTNYSTNLTKYHQQQSSKLITNTFTSDLSNQHHQKNIFKIIQKSNLLKSYHYMNNHYLQKNTSPSHKNYSQELNCNKSNKTQQHLSHSNHHISKQPIMSLIQENNNQQQLQQQLQQQQQKYALIPEKHPPPNPTSNKYLIPQQQQQLPPQQINNSLSHQDWLQHHLSNQPYIYSFQDKTQQFGLCYSLSNGIHIIYFNDSTSISIYNSQVLYLQPINYQIQYFQRILFKLINNHHNNSRQNKKYYKVLPNASDQNAKIQETNNPYKITLFKSNQLPQNNQIKNKYFTLINYSRKCIHPRQCNHKQLQLYKLTTMLKSWYRIQQTNQYIFITKSYIQIYFPQGTTYFILTNKQKILISNQQTRLQKMLQIKMISNKSFNKKLNKHFNLIQQFLLQFNIRQEKLKQQYRLFGKYHL